MATGQSIAFQATSQHRKEPKHCPTCGKVIPSHKHLYCGDKCRPSTYIATSQPRTHCAQCGGEMPEGISVLALYCSAKCKRSAAPRSIARTSNPLTSEQKEKYRKYKLDRHANALITGELFTCGACSEAKSASEFYATNINQCKACLKKKSSDWQKGKRSPESRARYLEAKKEYKKRNKDKEKVWAINYRVKIGDTKYSQHVRDWKRFKRGPVKHSAHVTAWRAYLSSLRSEMSAGWWARKLKAEGKPWDNPYFSDAMKYKIRYRMDLEFRLGEINRQTWRKETLKAREDGTVNFWVLLRERKTCPYCGTKITKENAVADHMVPVKLGGANSNHNLTICCRSCNQRKAGKPYDEWVRLLPEDRQGPAIRWFKRKHGYDPMARQDGMAFEFVRCGGGR